MIVFSTGSVQFPEGQPVEIKSAVVSLKSGKTVLPSLRLFYLQEEGWFAILFLRAKNLVIILSNGSTGVFLSRNMSTGLFPRL